MKAYTKTIPALTTRPSLMQTSLLILSGMLLQSCIMTTVVKEIENTVNSQEQHYSTKGETLKEGLLTIQIQNNAENTMLQIDSLEICNIQVMDSTVSSITIIKTPLQLKYGADTSAIYHHETNIPKTLPTVTTSTYAKIQGSLHSYLLNNETYPIYSGTMYYPLSATTTITIHPNCPLYAILNGSPQKVLQPISFSVTVEDWE